MPAKAASSKTSGSAFRDEHTSKVWNSYLEYDLTVGLESNVAFIKKQSQKSFRQSSTSKLRGGLSIKWMEKGCRTEWRMSACVFVPLCLCGRNGHGSISLICHSRSTPKISYRVHVPLEWRVCRSSPPPLQSPLQRWPSQCSFLGRTAAEGERIFK